MSGAGIFLVGAYVVGVGIALLRRSKHKPEIIQHEQPANRVVREVLRRLVENGEVVYWDPETPRLKKDLSPELAAFFFHFREVRVEGTSLVLTGDECWHSECGQPGVVFIGEFEVDHTAIYYDPNSGLVFEDDSASLRKYYKSLFALLAENLEVS